MLTAFPLQQWLHEHTSTLRYTYIASLGYPRLQSVVFITVFSARYLDLQTNRFIVCKTTDKQLLI